MVIRVNCPSCGKPMEVGDTAAGKARKCPHCRKWVKTPNAVYDAREVADDSGYEDDGSAKIYDFENMDASELSGTGSPALPDRRPCPMCGEMIVNTAAKCRYCGEIFDETLNWKSQKREKIRQGSKAEDEELTTLEWVFCILLSGIGCIIGIIYLIQNKPKGMKMIGFSILFNILWSLIYVVLFTLGFGLALGL